MDDEIGVMDVEVEESTAGGIALEEVLVSPTGGLGDATEPGVKDLAVDAGDDGLSDPGVFGPESDAEGGHEEDALEGGFLCGEGDALGFDGAAGDGFLDQDMLAGGECGEAEVEVGVGGGADVDGMDVGIGEELLDAAEGLYLGHVEADWILVSDITCDA